MELGRQNKSLNCTSISGTLRINVACKIVLQSTFLKQPTPHGNLWKTFCLEATVFIFHIFSICFPLWFQNWNHMQENRGFVSENIYLTWLLLLLKIRQHFENSSRMRHSVQTWRLLVWYLSELQISWITLGQSFSWDSSRLSLHTWCSCVHLSCLSFPL